MNKIVVALGIGFGAVLGACLSLTPSTRVATATEAASTATRPAPDESSGGTSAGAAGTQEPADRHTSAEQAIAQEKVDELLRSLDQTQALRLQFRSNHRTIMNGLDRTLAGIEKLQANGINNLLPSTSDASYYRYRDLKRRLETLYENVERHANRLEVHAEQLRSRGPAYAKENGIQIHYDSGRAGESAREYLQTLHEVKQGVDTIQRELAPFANS